MNRSESLAVLKFVWLTVLFAASAAGQGVDLSALDKLANHAKEVNTISLDGDNLHTAARFLSSDDPDVKEVKAIIEGIKGIWVRNLSFRGKDEYSEKDLLPIRRQLQTSGWSKVVVSKSSTERENTEVYLRTENSRTAGLAVISEEPRDLTVVVITGTIDLERLGKLKGNLGIPDIELKHKKKEKDEE